MVGFPTTSLVQTIWVKNEYVKLFQKYIATFKNEMSDLILIVRGCPAHVLSNKT